VHCNCSLNFPRAHSFLLGQLRCPVAPIIIFEHIPQPTLTSVLSKHSSAYFKPLSSHTLLVHCNCSLNFPPCSFLPPWPAALPHCPCHCFLTHSSAYSYLYPLAPLFVHCNCSLIFPPCSFFPPWPAALPHQKDPRPVQKHPRWAALRHGGRRLGCGDIRL